MIKESGEQKFFKGLFKAGGTEDKSDYRYAGGDYTRTATNNNYGEPHSPYAHHHLFVFTTTAPKLFPWIDKRPKYCTHCVCGNSIKEQCYMVNTKTKRTIVVGNCCIKRYMKDEYAKKCTVCGVPTKWLRREHNYTCNDCRTKIKIEQEIYDRWVRAYNETKDMDENEFNTKYGTYCYQELVMINHKLASWVMKSNGNYFLKRYLRIRLDFDEDYNVVGVKEPPKELSVYKTT